jgi:hypothetical protein
LTGIQKLEFATRPKKYPVENSVYHHQYIQSVEAIPMHRLEVVVITWMQILDLGCWTQDFASLDCTAWIHPWLQAMVWR